MGTHIEWVTGEQAELIARQEVPVMDTALTRTDSEVETYLVPVVELLQRLSREIHEMPISRRYRTDRTVAEVTDSQIGLTQVALKLTPAEFRRGELLHQVDRMSQITMELVGDLRNLIMGMEGTKLD